MSWSKTWPNRQIFIQALLEYKRAPLDATIQRTQEIQCWKFEREKKTSAKFSSRADSLTMTDVQRFPTAADLNASALEKPDTGGNAPTAGKAPPRAQELSQGCSAMVADGDGWYCRFSLERFLFTS